jgi:adenine-specific DNA-methyltransferase
MSSARQKQLGAFYTPPAMAEFLVGWAVRDSGDTVLDPSFGGEVFLDAAEARLATLGAALETVRDQIHGVDIDERAFASGNSSTRDRSERLQRDFFDVRAGIDVPLVQAVVGNPPYVRYQAFTESRERALSVAASHGVQLTRLTSSWAPFLVHASAFVAPGGRLAQVLPGELMHAQYAHHILDFLRGNFASVTVAVFEERVFPGAQEEVVLLLADNKGGGPADGVQLVQSRSVDDLPHTVETGRFMSPDGDHKLIAGLLDPPTLGTYDALARSHGSITRLGALASVDIGAVTGANDFFVLPAAAAAQLPARLMRPAVAKARNIPGARFRAADLRELDRSGLPSRLFVAGADDPEVADSAVQLHIMAGEARGIHKRYKCRIRAPWWALPARQARIPHFFMTYMSADIPRLVTNEAKAASTNTVHGVSLLNGANPQAVAASFYNSLTLLSAELVGRSYGGGVLKLEPTEAERLVVPTPQHDWAALLPTVDAALRARRYDELVRAVDDVVLVGGLGLSPRLVADLRAGHETLRARRLGRAKLGT